MPINGYICIVSLMIFVFSKIIQNLAETNCVQCVRLSNNIFIQVTNETEKKLSWLISILNLLISSSNNPNNKHKIEEPVEFLDIPFVKEWLAVK